jgi:hypothetical protein
MGWDHEEFSGRGASGQAEIWVGESISQMLPTRFRCSWSMALPDAVRFLELLGDLIVTARKAAKRANPPRWSLKTGH